MCVGLKIEGTLRRILEKKVPKIYDKGVTFSLGDIHFRIPQACHQSGELDNFLISLKLLIRDPCYQVFQK